LGTWACIQDLLGIGPGDEVEPVTIGQHGRFYVCEWVVLDQSLPYRRSEELFRTAAPFANGVLSLPLS
tara:strand:- start:117 stop:320 length:204 start_codon:yes stop_codon:yes gene_type:complete